MIFFIIGAALHNNRLIVAQFLTFAPRDVERALQDAVRAARAELARERAEVARIRVPFSGVEIAQKLDNAPGIRLCRTFRKRTKVFPRDHPIEAERRVHDTLRDSINVFQPLIGRKVEADGIPYPIGVRRAFEQALYLQSILRRGRKRSRDGLRRDARIRPEEPLYLDRPLVNLALSRLFRIAELRVVNAAGGNSSISSLLLLLIDKRKQFALFLAFSHDIKYKRSAGCGAARPGLAAIHYLSFETPRAMYCFMSD